ncbi:MFS transporter [bacterium]|nr:MFS transporter [bacterium]MDB4476227.1 MFS transporter [bacterium]
MTNPASSMGSFSEKDNRFRFVIAGFCFLLVLVNYLDRVVISFAIKPIELGFDIQDGAFGMLMSAFAVGTLATNGVSGFLLDRYGVKVVWSFALFLWSLFMILQGLVEVFWVFILLRVLMGMGEGANFPAMNRALVDWVHPKELGRVTSLVLLGVPLALLLGGLILAPAIISIGWRASFICLGIMGAILGVIFLIIYRQPSNKVLSNSSQEDVRGKVALRDMFLNPTLLATAWSFFAFGWVLFFGLTWLPGYLEETFDMKLESVGYFSTLPWAVSLLFMPLAGWCSDWIMRRTGSMRSARVHLIWICQLVAVIFFIPVMFVNTATSAVAFVSIAIGFSMAPNSPYYSICADLFPGRTGVATGFIVTFFSLSGVVCPTITGWLAEGEGGFTMAFTALCVVVGSAAMGMLFFARDEAAPTRAVTNAS